MIANDYSKTLCSEILASWPGDLNERADPPTIRSADAPLLLALIVRPAWLSNPCSTPR